MLHLTPTKLLWSKSKKPYKCIYKILLLTCQRKGILSTINTSDKRKKKKRQKQKTPQFHKVIWSPVSIMRSRSPRSRECRCIFFFLINSWIDSGSKWSWSIAIGWYGSWDSSHLLLSGCGCCFPCKLITEGIRALCPTEFPTVWIWPSVAPCRSYVPLPRIFV